MVVAVLAAAGAFRVFARRQRRLPHPLLDFAIFRNAAFVSGILAAGISLFAISGIQLVTTQRFQLVADFTPLEAGLLVVALAVGTLPTGLLGGAILHRVGLFPLVAGGLAVGLLGVVGTILALPVGLGWVVVGLVVTGLGLGAAMSVASTARLAVDGLGAYESLTGEPLAPELRRLVAEHLARAIAPPAPADTP